MGAARPFRQAGEMWCWQDSNLVASAGQNPRGMIADRLFGRLPRSWRRVLDWILTIAVAVALVLIFEAEVAKPYRVPSSSMEPTLHCARPGRGCLAHYSDRVIALRIIYRFRGPRRGEIAVFHAPPGAASCGESGSLTFIKRVFGLPGEEVSERNGAVFVNGKRLTNQYVSAKWRDHRTGSGAHRSDLRCLRLPFLEAADQVGHVGRLLLQVALVLLKAPEQRLRVGKTPAGSAAAVSTVVSSSMHVFTSSRLRRSGRESSAHRPARAGAPRPSGRAGGDPRWSARRCASRVPGGPHSTRS